VHELVLGINSHDEFSHVGSSLVDQAVENYQIVQNEKCQYFDRHDENVNDFS
jgi:hypothetical protein